jgi:hypothetical protein
MKTKTAKRARRTPGIRMLAVPDSTNLDAVGYDKQHEKLRVRFRDGAVYDYANVSSRRWAELVGAESIGTHFAAHIRHKFPSLRRRRPRARAHAS